MQTQNTLSIAVVTVVGLTGFAACGQSSEPAAATPAEEPTAAEPAADDPPEEPAGEEPAEAGPVASAELAPTEGNEASGEIRFRSVEGGVEVTGSIANLEPGSTHGFHIHENGDCSAPDGTSAGGHFSPADHDHGLPPTAPRHAGDMGNVEANGEGVAEIDETFDAFSMEGEGTIVGRGVILHADEDDGGQPTGNAGARIACGVIEAEG